MARAVSRFRRWAGAGTAVFLLAAGLSSCDDDGGTPPLAPDVIGTWMQVGGRYLLDPDREIQEAGVALALAIDDDSGGSLHLRTLATGIVTCSPLVYGLPADDQMLLSIGGGNLYAVARPDAGSLVLTDAAGHAAIFARVAAPPDSMLCSSLQIVRRFDLSLDIEGRTGLAYDGTHLWFTGRSAQTVIAVDPASGAVASLRRITVADAPLVHAAQGADLWRICGCQPDAPGAGKALRVAPDETIADKVDVRMLGGSAWVPMPWSMAHAPGSGSLWVYGPGRWPFDLLEIDARADPDVLLREIRLGFRADAMCWRGSELLAVTDNRVVRIDGSTFRVLRTYDSPDDLVLRGIAVAGPQVFALATPWASTQAVILELGL